MLLDPEVLDDYIESDITRRADGRQVARAVPGGTYVECLAERGDLASRRKPANHRRVNANEIDEALRDERNPFMAVVEQLAPGKLSRALLSDQFEILDILRWYHV